MMKSIRKSFLDINHLSATVITHLFAALVLFSICSICVSCKKQKQEQRLPEEIKTLKTNHKWYYFDDSNILPVDKPQNVPVKQFIPWTEAIRISSANNSTNSSYAIVNRLGMLCFNGKRFSLEKDISLFSERTSQNLVFFNDTPIFSVYKSAFFNNTILEPSYSEDDSQHYFLVQFDDVSKISYPVINSTNLTDKQGYEVTDFYWNGHEWCCSIKTISDTKNEFSYIRFKPLIPLLALSPSTAEGKIDIEECDVDFFRNSRVHHNYSDSPDRIKKLLSGFDTKLPFIIEVKNAGGSSPRIFENIVAGSTEKELNAKAILSASWSAALFEDGTLFLEGALPGKHILRSGKTVAIRLPKLPVGYVYSDFVISGTTLYAAWEETSFYKTGRAGFLQVNLDRTLYSRLI